MVTKNENELRTVKELAVRNDTAICANFIMIKNLLLKNVVAADRISKVEDFIFELFDYLLGKDEYAGSCVKKPILIAVKSKKSKKEDEYMVKLDVGSHLVSKCLSAAKKLKAWKSNVIECSKRQFVLEPVLSFNEKTKREAAVAVQRKLIELFERLMSEGKIVRKPFVSVRNSKFLSVYGDKKMIEVEKALDYYSDVKNLTFLQC